jgi:putative transposase
VAIKSVPPSFSACVVKLDVQLQILRYCSLVACPYYIFDARYEKVRHGGLLIDYAVLIALG